MKNILGLQIHHSLSYCLKFFMQINRIWTKLCQLKLGGPVIMPHSHCVYAFVV